MGLDVYLYRHDSPPTDEGENGGVRIETNSAKYPDHYFKIGYLRSSYNSGGLNHILRNLGVADLYDIFQAGNDGYYIRPDWNAALVRAKEALELLRAKANLKCFKIDWNQFRDPRGSDVARSEQEALAQYLEYSNKQMGEYEDGEGYSNSVGNFWPKGLKIFSVISGMGQVILTDKEMPCVYVVAGGDNEWYIQALEITIETIEFVLGESDRDKYYFHWSS